MKITNWVSSISLYRITSDTLDRKCSQFVCYSCGLLASSIFLGRLLKSSPTGFDLLLGVFLAVTLAGLFFINGTLTSLQYSLKLSTGSRHQFVQYGAFVIALAAMLLFARLLPGMGLNELQVLIATITILCTAVLLIALGQVAYLYLIISRANAEDGALGDLG